MLLKKIEILGFKSFADRTEVNFTPGVTAVVGPNGSGKSNISDAILWVLGEQNVRNIRGNKSQDVIFAGTDKRKPVSMAEVSLTIDNSSGKLPLDFSEITVTRRAYRSGESEFLINKTPCRLKDIYELFMDTGVGREAYSIVSQGELDAVLSAKSEDRRALFDEAAGIKKYRYKKKEAERKLESTDQNLNRVNDIIFELHDQLEPMAEQAKIAARYLELASRLEEIEVGILVGDLQKYNSEIQKIRNEKDIDSVNIDKINSEYNELIIEKNNITDALNTADFDLEYSQSEYQDAASKLEKTENQLALIDQQYENALSIESTLSLEISQLSEKIKINEAHKTELQKELSDIADEVKRISSEHTKESAEILKLQENLYNKSSAANNQKTEYIELAKRLATQRNEYANYTQRIDQLKSLLSRRNDEIAKLNQTIKQTDSQLVEIQAEIDNLKSEEIINTKRIEETQTAIKEAQNEIRNYNEILSQVNKKSVERQSRLKTLQEMEDSKEGYFQGVRSVISAVKSNKLTGNYAIVADTIKVPKGYETAYEIALGSSLQDIITETDFEAKNAVEYLKQNHAGRATFLPLNMMRYTSSPMLKEIAGKNDIIGVGSDLISFDEKYAPAINSLLSKTLIVKDIDAAINASKNAMGWSKIVTIDGELILPSGAITGGRISGKTANILGRKQEIETLKTEISELDVLHMKTESTLKKSESKASTLNDEFKKSEDNRSALKIKILETEKQFDFTRREQKRYMSELYTLDTEKSGIEEDLAKAEIKQNELKTAVESADRENIDLDSLIIQTEKEIKDLQSEIDEINTKLGTLNVSKASLIQKQSGIEQNIRNITKSLTEIDEEIKYKQNNLLNSDKNKTETTLQRTELESLLETIKKNFEETKIKTEYYREIKHNYSVENQSADNKIKDLTERKDSLSQKVHNAEIKETRLDMQISQAIIRLLEEYDITAEDALNRVLPDEREGSAAEVARLRREIKSMGEVNTGAVQEFARISERYEFLNNQRTDLTEAREKLIDAIMDIDRSTRGIFMETFKATDEAFRVMFMRLFGGGTTELILTDPENLQDSGIDVMVEMPGKKRQNLLLLSGGERALTASALMFALMIVRPSPFCVLDEIDAPLDEANVERFADVIREFAERSQIIIITHNKATMEAADVLYGVTMQEPGISKLISVQIKDTIANN